MDKKRKIHLVSINVHTRVISVRCNVTDDKYLRHLNTDDVVGSTA